MSEEFGENKENRRSITEKYRLAVIDEENLVEVKSFRVSLLNLYTLFSSIVILLGVVIVSLIFFTPMKRLVPGYGNVEQNVEFLRLRDEVNKMEKTLETQELYNQSLRKMIKGDISNDIILEGNTDL